MIKFKTRKFRFALLCLCVFSFCTLWLFIGCHIVSEFRMTGWINGSLCRQYSDTGVGTAMEEPVFVTALRKHADGNKTVVLSLMDSGTVDMASNLYITSYKKLAISNYLFISSDNVSCSSLHKEFPELHCIQYVSDKDARAASSFGSKAFVRKTHYKTMAVLEAVQLGYNVLLVDIDIVMFQNPFPYLSQCGSCDLQIQWDHNMVCSGFFLVRSTEWGLKFMERVWNITVTKGMTSNDQKYVSTAFNEFKEDSRFVQKVLPEAQFSNGNEYFSQRHIMFATDAEYPPELHLVHDNWIVSQAAKVYRFKENLMWMNDRSGYYTDRDTKYLQYSNPERRANDSRDILDDEVDALKAALIIGHLLNRVVILPSFTCAACDTKKVAACLVKNGRCSFQTYFKVEQFDKYFKGLYREHVFLLHPLVPDIVKTSKSGTIVTEYKNNQPSGFKVRNDHTKSYRTLEFLDKVINCKDLQKWFSDETGVSVLVFEQLHDILPKFSMADKVLSQFNSTLHSAFKASTYIQR